MVNGDVRNGFAVIRPPGHHAEYDTSMGFCLFNNVPIAARVCQGEFPKTRRRVLVLDWGAHHGNGMQKPYTSCGSSHLPYQFGCCIQGSAVGKRLLGPEEGPRLFRMFLNFGLSSHENQATFWLARVAIVTR